MRKLKLPLLVIILFTLFSCATNKVFLPEHHTYLSVGSVGGFAGSFKEYRLLPNGQFFKRTQHNGKFITQKSISINQTNQFYNIVKGFRDDKYVINEPGNLSYYIKWVNKDQEAHELVWGSGETEVDKRLLLLYSTIRKMSADPVYTR